MISLGVGELMAASSLIFDRFFGGEEGITTNRAKAPLLLGLSFTREEAIAYATREGIAFRVQEPKEGKRRQISYSDNFRYDRKIPWTH